MIIHDDGTHELEGNEPLMRSCWECRLCHAHLKHVNRLYWCFECERHWIFGQHIQDLFEGVTEEEGNAKLVNFLKSKGVKPGESTTQIESPYKGPVMFSFISRG